MYAAPYTDRRLPWWARGEPPPPDIQYYVYMLLQTRELQPGNHRFTREKEREKERNKGRKKKKGTKIEKDKQTD